MSGPASRRDLFPDIDAFVVAGFFTLSALEREIVRTLSSWEGASLFLVRGAGIEDAAEALGAGAPPGPEEGGGPVPLPEMTFTKSPDAHGQVFALNSALEAGFREPARLDERQVVVLPSAESLFPLYQQTLSTLTENDYNISMGYPLGRTPIFTFFDKLLELLASPDEDGRVYAPHYLRFVLHPYAKNIFYPGAEKRTDLTRILFHAIEEQLTRRRMRSAWSLPELETDPEIWDEVRERIRGVDDAPPLESLRGHLRAIHARLIAPFFRLANVGDFAEKAIAALDFIARTSTARQHFFFHPYAEAFAARLDGLARSELRGLAFEEKASYFSLFRKVTASGAVPFFGTPLRGLQVLGFWETRGLSFDEVHILDMNEGVIPGFRKADTLLPFAARQALGLPTYKAHERRMAYYFDVLIRGAGRAHVYFVESKDKERSRFVEALIWEKQKADRRRGRKPTSGRSNTRSPFNPREPADVPRTARHGRIPAPVFPFGHVARRLPGLPPPILSCPRPGPPGEGAGPGGDGAQGHRDVRPRHPGGLFRAVRRPDAPRVRPRSRGNAARGGPAFRDELRPRPRRRPVSHAPPGPPSPGRFPEAGYQAPVLRALESEGSG